MASNFLSNENVKLMQDILFEHKQFKILVPSKQNQIKILFSNNLQKFYQNGQQRGLITLLDYNKEYLSLIIGEIKKDINNVNNGNNVNKIKIHDCISQPVKEKKSSLDMFEKKKKEFDDEISLKKPMTPNFSDYVQEEPIKEMDEKIKEIVQQRNYDIQQISHISKSHENPSNWLKPMETSIKGDRNQIQNNEINQNNQNNNRFKYLNKNPSLMMNEYMDNNDMIVNNNVTFSDNIETIRDDIEDNTNFFSKLKRIDERKEDFSALSSSESLRLESLRLESHRLESLRLESLRFDIQEINKKIDMILNFLQKDNSQ
jgi:hypothetical protein